LVYFKILNQLVKYSEHCFCGRPSSNQYTYYTVKTPIN